jgi:hypothetical protein
LRTGSKTDDPESKPTYGKGGIAVSDAHNQERAAIRDAPQPMIVAMFDIPDSLLEGDGFEPSVPFYGELRTSGACDATHAAIVKPGTPIVRVDELGERFAARLGRFHID